jgi:aspartokinase-like uncharacterized kinase
MDTPLVMKVGGSLFHRIPSLIHELNDAGRRILIVPGGGVFADRVRELGLDEESSHWMAISAMEQVGWYIASFGVHAVDEPAEPEGLEVLLPYMMMRRLDPLPHSWDVTSDTIAAWVAGFLKLDLVILKSVDGIHADGELLGNVTSPVECDEVDSLFIPYVLEHKIKATIVNGLYPDRIRRCLDGSATRGTVIHPRL